MNFIEIISAQFRSLENKNIVFVLYKNIVKTHVTNIKDLIEFSFHVPLDSDTFLEELIRKFDELDKDELRNMDGQVKAYLLSYIHYCIEYNKNLVKTTILASNLFMKLILVPGIGKYFFEPYILMVQIRTFVKTLVTNPTLPTEMIMSTMNLYKEYCIKEHLESKVLVGIANLFMLSMVNSSRTPIVNIDEAPPIARFAMTSLTEIIAAEKDELKLRSIMLCFFNILSENFQVYIHCPTTALSIIKVFIRDVLQNEIGTNNMEHLLDSFSLYWKNEEFTKFEEAVEIMNTLHSNHYSDLVNHMCMYTMCENHKNYWDRIMYLVLAMAKNPPPFNLRIIAEYYIITIDNIVSWMAQEDKTQSNKVIDMIAKFCLLDESQLVQLVFKPLQVYNVFGGRHVDFFLSASKKLAESKWGVSPRNQNLLVILMKVVETSKPLNENMLCRAVEALCMDYTPSVMLPSLPILHRLFCTLMMKKQQMCAGLVMEIMYNCAMHSDAASQNFLLHLYRSMTFKSNLETHKLLYYTEVLLSDSFNYNALFSKLKKYIGPSIINLVIDSFNLREKSFAILLKCLVIHSSVEFTDCMNLLVYILQNFDEVSSSGALGALCSALDKILQSRTILETDLEDLDRLFSLIMDGLFNESYHPEDIKCAYRLLMKIKGILNIDNDRELNQLMEIISERALRAIYMRRAGDLGIITYLNELCLVMQKAPLPYVINTIENMMDDKDEKEEIKNLFPEIYIQLLSLFTIHGMLRKRKANVAVKHLNQVLKDPNPLYKLAGFRMYYSLCKTRIIRDYEPIFTFVFREIMNSHVLVMKTCLYAIEQLIHNNHLKLDHEQFFKCIHVVGCENVSLYARTFMSTRFIPTCQNDIAVHYVRSLVYLHHYTGLACYPITSEFDNELIKIELKMNCKHEVPLFLFTNVSIKYKFNILSEVSSVFDLVVAGECIIDDNFFILMNTLCLTFRYIQNPTTETGSIPKNYYENVMNFVENKIVEQCRSYKPEKAYAQYEPDIKRCTLSILKLLFWNNVNVSHKIQIPLFDAVMHWIDFVKDEIINYIYQDNSKAYGKYFTDLVSYYNLNRSRFKEQKSFALELPGDKD
ncbi:unnamed protein product [Diabrotica balteata]|uniref:Uncharacterized protein n=1 Tax=Diabrotica balteata TaxID=107213 RepID=A0A9N9SSF7_DIABA|nr:unnamed protein product [Diabrotica balteata]